MFWTARGATIFWRVLAGRTYFAGATGLRQPDPDPNRQAQKGAFLRDERGGALMTAQGYSEFLPEPRKFYWELKAGTIIPGILVTGVDSDLPGQIVG